MRAGWWLVATALIAACAAPSENTTTTASSSDAGLADSSSGPSSARTLPDDPAAVARVEALRARFVYPATDSGELASLVPASEARSIALEHGRLVPRLPDAANPSANALRASARFSTAADGPWTIGWRGVEADVTLRGAHAVRGVSAAGAIVYEGALPAAALVHVPGWTGTEELVHFERKPAEPALRYDVATRGAAGFRLYDGTFEVLDADGYPRLRTTAPTVVDARGTVRRGTLAVEGCAYDASEQAPWGRPLTAPNSERCTVTSAWDDHDLVYPLLVDPAWTNTAGLAQKRSQHTANALKSSANATCSGGCVLATGGYNAGGLTSTELYSVTGGTWSTIAANPVVRWNHTATTTHEPNQRVLVAGGCTGTSCSIVTSSTYTWDPVNNWVSRGDLSGGGRSYLASASVDYWVGAQGYYDSYVTGGENASAMASPAFEVFHANTNAWGAGALMLGARSRHAMIAWNPGCGGSCIPQPFAVVAGGLRAGTVLDTVEYWDGAWHPSNNLTTPAYALTAALTSDRAYFAGGFGAGGTFVDDLHAIGLKTPATVTKIGDLSAPRGFLAGTTFGTSPSRAIFTGGETCAYGSNVVDVADTTGLLGSTRLNQGRTEHAAVRLPDGRAMVVGGFYKNCVICPCNGAASYPTYEEIYTPLAQGTACTGQADCASLYCVDGYCCDSACTGLCQACSAAKTGGADGTCASVTAGTDPDSDCAADPQNTCQKNGMCDGAGACQLWGSTTACASSTCAAGLETDYKCNGAGSCQSSNVSCGAYLCDSSTCFTSCTADANCAAGYYCTSTSGGACVAKKVQGGACASDPIDPTGGHQCSNGNCADGFCCDTACAGVCQACSAAKKGSGADGQCGNVGTGSDPDSECAQQAASTCGTDGTCNGNGACRLWQSGIACGATTCTGGNQTGLSCNGLGVCGSATTACAPYVCGASACLSSCNADGDCIGAYWCRTSDHTCQPDQAPGATCSAAGQCTTNFCVDGFCCDTACAGTCQACSGAKKGSGSNGQCGPIAASSDPDNECSTDSASTCQKNGFCSGAGSCQLYAAGTPCGATTCSGGSQTGYSCNGLGACGTATTQCTPYVCGASACLASCNSDADCATSSFCRTSDHTCQPDQSPGAACATGSQCSTNFCVDGFCCDTACAGTCQACSKAKKGAGSDGQCGNVAASTDPDGDCNDQGAASCGTNGSCSGFGSCALYANGTACGSTTCSGGTQTGQACNGSGTCAPSTSTSCAPYLCSGSACGTSCTSDLQCIPSYFCRTSDSTCQPDQPNGGACTSASHCASGNCVDGVCCDTACAGTCVACSAAKKGSGADGACGSIAASTDPDNECASQSATTCGTNGYCSGTGTCALYAAGTACGATTCSSGTQTGYACNGLGTCASAATSNCSPYLCAGNACGVSCATDNDCIGSYFCRTSDHTCQPDQAKGGACTAASQCATGNCVDGVCCDTACAGTCMACSAAKKGTGQDGSCEAVGGGTDPDNECADQGAASCGANGTCSGLGSCALYPSGTACGSTSCSGGKQTGQACNGAGTCQDASTTSCAPYLCAGSTCGASCSDDSQCVGTYFCDVASHTCKPDQASGGACTSASQCSTGNCVDGFCCDTACAGACVACSAAKKGSGADGVCGGIAAGSDPDNECADQGATTCGTSGSCNGSGGCALYALGTACGTTSCTSGVQTGQACDGAGTCTNASTTPCSPNVCVGNACGTTCVDDSQCVGAYFCDVVSHTCKPDQASGGACTSASQCSTNFCVDGFCCDTACAGACVACSAAKKGSGADGVCDGIAAGDDPDNECADQGVASCGTDGACDGSGSCELYANGIACGATSCSNGIQTGQACNGSGSCLSAATTPCTPYTCAGNACATSCNDDSACIDTYFCDLSAHQCQPDQAAGVACVTASQCSTGNCVDGFCCDTACTGSCQACSAAKKGAGADGVCGNVVAGSDPKGDCADDGAISCGHDGQCDGNGACRYYAQGVACGDTTCQGNVVKGHVCDGIGSCITDSSGTDCSPYVCNGAGCAKPCATDADCILGDFCDKGVCTAKVATGKSCTAAAECETGVCADGVCCDTACSGQCEACDVAGSVGTCTPVKGAPHPKHSACSSDGSSCGGSCNGVSRDACIYPSATEICGTTCKDAQEIDSLCDGHGSCVVGQPKSCPKNLGCDGTTKCKTTCAADGDCAKGFVCDKGQCTPPVQATCDGDHTTKTSDGKTIDCAPFKCDANGSCKSSCASVDECVAPAVCDANGKCVAPAAAVDASSEEGGCGCRVAGRSDERGRSGAALLLVGLGLALGARRRRSSRLTS